MEQRLLRDIVALQDVTGAALLDGEGFVLFSEPSHDDSVPNLGKAIALFDPEIATKRVTLNAENGTIIVEQLRGNRVLVVRCNMSANLGKIRHSIDTNAAIFNALIP